MYQRRVAANIVYACFVSNLFKGFCELYGAALGCCSKHSYRSYGKALVNNRNTVSLFDFLACLDVVAGKAHHLFVDFSAGLVNIAVDTVKKADTHCDCTDIKVLLLYHLYSFKNIV